MPGQSGRFASIAKHPTDQARAPAQPCTRGYLSIAGHSPGRNPGNRIANRLMFRPNQNLR
jgi:hypothetical protein